MGMRPVKLDVHVEELMLLGFAPGDRYRIGDAMQRELAHLFAEQGTPPSLVQEREVARLDSGTFEVSPDSKADAIGVQVAQAVYVGLSR
jgi:hypothetical protein